MEVFFSPMRAPGCALRAGAHSSDGWHVDTPWHRHDMHQLLYAFEGSVEVEGRLGRYKVPRQFVAWIPAGVVHRTSIQRVASGSVFLSADMLACDADAPRVVPAPPLMREMVMYAMRWPLDRTEDPRSHAYFECLARLCEEWLEAEVKLILPGCADPRIGTAIEHLRQRPATATFGDACRQAGMSERSLRRHFKRSVGLTWEEYRRRLRIYLALDQLDRTSTPIGLIAAAVGYDNQAAFAKAFRTLVGVGPGDYRRRTPARAAAAR
jgi:AraC-like DNA-binding protein